MLISMKSMEESKYVTKERINAICEAHWMNNNAGVEIIMVRTMVLMKNAFNVK